MKPNDLKNQIDKFIILLQENNLVVDSDRLQIKKYQETSLVGWASIANIPPRKIIDNYSSISEYLWVIENKHYTCLFHDGSAVQIEYHYVREDIVKHRLAYYPCPVHIDLLDTQDQPIREYIEGAMVWENEILKSRYLELEKDEDLDITGITMKTPIRFDYYPEDFKPGHSKSHLHIIHDGFRLPVQAPLSPGHFFRFLLRNFYSQNEKCDFLCNSIKPFLLNRCIESDEELGLHIGWRNVL